MSKEDTFIEQLSSGVTSIINEELGRKLAICITIPRDITWKEYERELAAVADGSQGDAVPFTRTSSQSRCWRPMLCVSQRIYHRMDDDNWHRRLSLGSHARRLELSGLQASI